VNHTLIATCIIDPFLFSNEEHSATVSIFNTIEHGIVIASALTLKEGEAFIFGFMSHYILAVKKFGLA
jgi:hypothetical protein